MSAIYFKTRGYTTTNSKLYNTVNTDTQFKKECTNCNIPHTVSYQPVKTMRKTDNISQKMKYSSFVRRTQDHQISYYDTVQFQFRNL